MVAAHAALSFSHCRVELAARNPVGQQSCTDTVVSCILRLPPPSTWHHSRTAACRGARRLSASAPTHGNLLSEREAPLKRSSSAHSSIPSVTLSAFVKHSMRVVAASGRTPGASVFRSTCSASANRAGELASTVNTTARAGPVRGSSKYLHSQR